MKNLKGLCFFAPRACARGRQLRVSLLPPSAPIRRITHDHRRQSMAHRVGPRGLCAQADFRDLRGCHHRRQAMPSLWGPEHLSHTSHFSFLGSYIRLPHVCIRPQQHTPEGLKFHKKGDERGFFLFERLNTFFRPSSYIREGYPLPIRPSHLAVKPATRN